MSAGAGRRGRAGSDPPAGRDRPDEDSVLMVPPIPLATGNLLEPDDHGPPVPIRAVELVVSTDDGELRIPLVHRQGAWWAP